MEGLNSETDRYPLLLVVEVAQLRMFPNQFNMEALKSDGKQKING